MTKYIANIETLVEEAPFGLIPPEVELHAASYVLSRCPIQMYPAFTEMEVRIVGCYRYSFSLSDPVWKSIFAGSPEAWIFAVHEAAELNAFAQMGLSPFDKQQWLDGLGEAHLQATVVEVEFLKRWSEQSGLTLSELAIEAANPIRGQFTREHTLLIAKLARNYGWSLPAENEQEQARQWWLQILETKP
jgi:hypothetical protein